MLHTLCIIVTVYRDEKTVQLLAGNARRQQKACALGLFEDPQGFKIKRICEQRAWEVAKWPSIRQMLSESCNVAHMDAVKVFV